VSQVLSGAKILTPEQCQALAAYLELTPMEAEFIAFMVQKERAGTNELRMFWEAKLQELRHRSLALVHHVSADRSMSEQEKSVFYSSPLYSAISLYTSIGEAGKTLAEICERFDLSRGKALGILTFLVKANLCREEKNRYFQGTQNTHLDDESPYLLKHHSNWRLRAVRQSEDLSKQELMYTAPISLSKNDFKLLREEMVHFIKRFLDKVHASPAEEIACFNLDFFWVKK